MAKTNNVTILCDQIVNGITLLSPNQGDILFFHMKTDRNGFPLYSLEDVKKLSEEIKDTVNNDKIKIIFMPDKIYLDSIKTAEGAIKSLENTISYVSEAAEMIQSQQKQKEREENFELNDVKVEN